MTSALALASPALADTTVGQTGTPSPDSTLIAGFENINPSAVVPGSGTITSLQTQSATADVCASQGTGKYDFQVLRPQGNNQYLVLGDTGDQTDPCDGQLHSYSVNVAVQAGDVLGAYVVQDWAGLLTVGARQYDAMPEEPAVGQSVSLPNPGSYTLDLAATLASNSDADLALTNVPANVTTGATSPAGAVVSYTPPTAVDEEPAQVNCVPASGTTFAIGTTTVTCTAGDSDDSNAPVSASFTVHVEGAAEQLSDLALAAADVSPGRSLENKVARAQFDLASGHSRAACRALEAFSDEVRALAWWRIPLSTAAGLITDAQRIEAVLGCAWHHRSDREGE